MTDDGTVILAAPGRGRQPPLVELEAPIAAAGPDAVIWQAWLDDLDTLRRFEALIYCRGPDQCAYWLGAISSTGHGKFRAGSRARARWGNRARRAEPDRDRARIRLPSPPRHHRGTLGRPGDPA